MRKIKIIVLVISVFSFFLSDVNAWAQNKTETIPVYFKASSDSSVSAISFHIEYNPDNLVFKEAKAGPAVLSAGKQLSSNGKDKGIVRLIVFGLNNSVITEGVLAEVSFDNLASGQVKNTDLKLTNYSASSPAATTVPLAVENGFTIIVSKHAIPKEKPIKIRIQPVKRFLIWRSYKLALDNADKIMPVSWSLAEKQKLPFLLRLDKKKGTIYGIAWGKKSLELNVIVTTKDRRKIALPCKLEIR